MKGIEKITARIAADAEKEKAALWEAASERIEEIRAEYEKKADDAYQEHMRTGLRDAEQYASRIERTAQLETKKAVLALRQEMVSEAFKLAESKITAMPEQQYVEYLTRKVLETGFEGDAQLVMNEKDKAGAGPVVVEAVNAARREAGLEGVLTLADDTKEMLGGFILRQGNVEVNCTVDIILELIRGEAAAQVAKVLFEE
ncbi:MAG: V-type ATP synthase subunit E [Firmicutes bacterium]|nr:V-type ATP synthase subunit E [Bacillota bacterium]MBR1990552.1 V-type ATP synthase subunit E [Bacillota bacterium]MBR3706816.1 V-type ATP synthase subunit E [Bacillota bacterium]